MKSKSQYYKEAVAEYLARPRPFTDMSRSLRENTPDDEFSLEGHRFAVVEAEFSNVITFTKMRLISVKSVEFPDMDAMTIMYELPDFWKRSVDLESRVAACKKLAQTFVRNMLPKVDWNFKMQLHNEEVEEALAWLDQE
jgi:hypothetical protein